MAWLVVVAFHGLGVASAIHAIMTTRTEQGTIAWVVSLLAVPYVAVPAYWVFGRSRFEGYVAARRGNLQEIAGVTKEAVTAVAPFRMPPAEVDPAARAAQQMAGLPCLQGNSVELLVNGDATFRSIFQGIDAARAYVLVEFYIVHDDEIGREFKERLIARARAGVQVRFLYDEVGSHDLPRAYINELRAAGIQVHEFHTRKGPRNRFQLNFRNHRKIVVVDGQVAWIGGHNVGDEYLSRNPKIGPWRDTHIRIVGPAALGAQLAFAEDWHWAAGDRLDVRWDPVPSRLENVPVLIVPSSPADTLETANLMYIHAINSAQERVWIASPYYVPDKPVTDALQLAGLRGVDVRILIPDKSDNPLVGLAAYSYVDDSSFTGGKFYRYGAGFLHEKVMLVDRCTATVGTANFDNRSFRLNFEITAVISDAVFAAEVERMFEADFARSRVMDPGEYDRQPWWFRFEARLARLTGPVQ
ncbi:MAG: cls [candidate division NC10 bacterium]|nr:cls [candidate division NC10 bacterium]